MILLYIHWSIALKNFEVSYSIAGIFFLTARALIGYLKVT